jgi:phosphoribosylanthranilate isomerase
VVHVIVSSEGDRTYTAWNGICSGEQFDWRNFQAPSMESRRGWMLAGGLTPSNVATALSLVTPDAVDVSSGIAGSCGILKDPARIHDFIQAVQNSSMVTNVG